MTPIADETRTVYEKIAVDLRRQIAAGTLRPGDRLDSVRKIAEQFDASPGTAKQALHLLRSWGLVYADSTRGYFVSSEPVPQDETGPGPELEAVMREIRAVRDEVRGLGERLQRLEELVQGAERPAP
ncbi:hypothetical protein AQ490_08235 [Wenjunlia vitaminophila]|uniref:HTH gntR-type domain-containing protein n=1 Tax=Wenjunlia vitaminophila TaxID=76728 RepID=A0A0T6LN88_WENVI|nr:winged helix-turn-helix domain-containing protein [Wenjunlia vitaminophila]KRV47428.1 hypothetical protein AQ490_08235 [Wenjunlia vitaminophila]